MGFFDDDDIVNAPPKKGKGKGGLFSTEEVEVASPPGRRKVKEIVRENITPPRQVTLELDDGLMIQVLKYKTGDHLEILKGKLKESGFTQFPDRTWGLPDMSSKYRRYSKIIVLKNVR